ncbi:hypothetical protein Hanom_Chr05g00423461 [Helianthus anomalus]
MKEIGKASQASAAATYETRDKAVQDLEVANLNFQETQSKLVEVEEKWKMKRHEMQMAYDKFLADHVRLENEKEEVERSRKMILEAHQEVLAQMTEQLNHVF